jgi:hypothetical protein
VSTLEWARYYISKGFSVIPLRPHDKKPAIPSWKEYQNRQPTGEELVMWFGNDSKNNIGIVTGAISGICVLDFDTQEAYEEARKSGLSDTPIAKTGKGYHCYFKYRDGIGNFQNSGDLKSLDIRGDGGYVVAPPSVHPSGHQYCWVEGKGLDDIPLTELPEIFLPKNPDHKTPLREIYKGVKEGSRDVSLTRIVGSLVRDGLTFEECLALAQSVNERNLPMLDPNEVYKIAGSIYTKEHRGKSDLLSSLLEWNDILTLDVKTEYILEKVIPKGSITLLFGRGGIGKTSLMLPIAKAIAMGIPFGNLQTLKMPVYCVDFENPLSFLKERVEKIGASENLWIWHISNETPPPRLDSKDWELYKQLPPGLIIIDSFRASHLSDENNSKDMAIIMSRLKELREKGFTIVLLHHTPKGNEGIYKGSTAILDLADHILGLEEIKGEDTFEFNRENLYRLDVRIKTRYEPHHIFLTFNPEIKGFEIAKDPDIEKMKAIHEILIESTESLNQTELRERASKALGLPDKEVRRLLKKGIEYLYWNIEKGDKNAIYYIPISLSVCQSIYTGQTNNQASNQGDTLTNTLTPNSKQSLDNTEFVSLSDSIKQADKQEG